MDSLAIAEQFPGRLLDYRADVTESEANGLTIPGYLWATRTESACSATQVDHEQTDSILGDPVDTGLAAVCHLPGELKSG
jgi:hypothetical protein